MSSTVLYTVLLSVNLRYHQSNKSYLWYSIDRTSFLSLDLKRGVGAISLVCKMDKHKRTWTKMNPLGNLHSTNLPAFPWTILFFLYLKTISLNYIVTASPKEKKGKGNKGCYNVTRHTHFFPSFSEK